MNCPFCGHDPYHYVNNGLGMVPVAIVCCEPMCAVSSKDQKDDAEYVMSVGELRALSAKIATLQARHDAYEEKYGEIFQDLEVTE